MEPPRRDGAPWTVLLGVLVVLGVALRLFDFTRPAAFVFDEHHFVENARNYLAGKADWNDHPPLGKLVMAACMRLLGDTTLAWRLPAQLAGAWVVLGGGVAAARLFDSRRAGLVAAALLSADGFFIGYSRLGLLDGLLAASLVTALLLCTLRWGWRLAAAGGVVLGAAVSVKFSGVALVVPLAVSAWLTGAGRARVLGWGALTAALAVVTYVGLYALGLQLTGQPAGPGEVLAATRHLLAHHAGLTEMKHGFTSGWATWFVPLRAPVMYATEVEGLTRALSMLGNLATWWASSALAVASVLAVLRMGAEVLQGAPPPAAADASFRAFVRQHGRAVLVLLAGAVGFLAPWALSHRDSYLYHYLPAYAALVLLLAGFVGWQRTHRPRLALGFLCLVLVVAGVYAPLWSTLPLSRDAMHARLFLEGWR